MDPGVTLYPLDSRVLAHKYRKWAVNILGKLSRRARSDGEEVSEGHGTALINQVSGTHPYSDPVLPRQEPWRCLITSPGILLGSGWGGQ